MNIKKLQTLQQKLDDIRCSLQDVKAAADEVFDRAVTCEMAWRVLVVLLIPQF